ncbi:MAG TPA: hypothetical protein VGC51_02420 [Hansschlegelia sp.]
MSPRPPSAGALLLHVGPHKTATTYLQSNFYGNRAALLERGWLYPKLGERVRIGHHDIADRPSDLLRKSGPAHDDLRRLADEAVRGANILLSSEGFRRWRPAHYDALKEIFAPRELRLCYVIRDPMSVLHALWAQTVSLGGTETLPSWIETHRLRGRRSRILNPMIEIGSIVRRPETPCTFLLYDEIARRGLDIFRVFTEEALGAPAIAPRPSAPANKRPPAEMTEFIRLLSMRSPHIGEDGGLHAGEAVRYLLSEPERRTIVETIRRDGAAARRTIEISRQTPGYLALERDLIETLGPAMRPQPERGKIFLSEPEAWTWYDDTLPGVPSVAALLTKAERKTRPGGVGMTIANETKRLLRLGRRVRKRLLPVG